MKVLCVTNHFLHSVKSLFPEAEVIPGNSKGEECDLLIFTGGTDVNPARYGSNHAAWETPDTERDDFEIQIISDVRRGRIEAKKVLGICRGLQVINVALGGTLVGDIFSQFNMSHNAVHPIKWVVENKISAFLPVVNSLHHQGIENIGHRLDNRVLGVEPSTQIIEAILWYQNGVEKILGVQFHPEFFSDSPEKTKFGNLIRDWVEGKENIYPRSPFTPSPKEPGLYDFTVNWGPTISGVIGLESED